MFSCKFLSSFRLSCIRSVKVKIGRLECYKKYKTALLASRAIFDSKYRLYTDYKINVVNKRYFTFDFLIFSSIFTFKKLFSTTLQSFLRLGCAVFSVLLKR